MKVVFSFFMLLLFNSLTAVEVEKAIEGVDYIFCIDGGGSHTRLQVLNGKGEVQALWKGQRVEEFIDVSSSKVSNVGPQGVAIAFDELFIGLKVGEGHRSFKNIVKRSALVAGFAGMGRETERTIILEEILSWGFRQEKVSLHTDINLALHLNKEYGGCLISGMGSICLYKDQGVLYRAGGFGRLLSDEGSGYDLAIQAIKAGLENEYGYGIPTQLTGLVKTHFNVQKVSELITTIHNNELPPEGVATFTPLLFDSAWKGDQRALELLTQGANHLGFLIASALRKSTHQAPIIHLVGGIFRNEKAYDFMDMISQSPELQALPKAKRPVLKNMGKENIPYLVVSELLQSKKNS